MQPPANLRVALKDDDMHILVPGELATPFKRSGYEVTPYIPASALLSHEAKAAMLNLLGERGWHATASPEEGAEPDLAAVVAKAHRDLGDALQAAVDHLGGTDRG